MQRSPAVMSSSVSKWACGDRAKELFPERAHGGLTGDARAVRRRPRVLEHAVLGHPAHDRVHVVAVECLVEAFDDGARRVRHGASLTRSPPRHRCIVGSDMSGIRSWLGLTKAETPEHAPLRELVNALDRLEPERARHIARFAYLLGRVAHADRHVSPAGDRDDGAARSRAWAASPPIRRCSSSASRNRATCCSARPRTTKWRESSRTGASYEEKRALARCLFATAATDDAISMTEETEIHRILTQLRIEPSDLTALRVEHRGFLPGLTPRRDGSAS